MPKEKNRERFAKYENAVLYIKVEDGETTITELGPIETRRGGLTRRQKLKAVAGQGEWVKL